jgi:GNAT superfamily N-acetyltransferase
VSVQIRAARPEDGPSFVALVRALAEFEKLPGPDAAAAVRLCEHAFADPPRYHLLIAEVDGRTVGYAVYFFCYSTFLARPSLYLEDLFVHPDARGHGIGGAFMRALAALAVEHECGRFEWTVLDWNVRAQKFYQGLGARLLPEWQLCRLEGDAILALAGARVRGC